MDYVIGLNAFHWKKALVFLIEILCKYGDNHLFQNVLNSFIFLVVLTRVLSFLKDQKLSALCNNSIIDYPYLALVHFTMWGS